MWPTKPHIYIHNQTRVSNIRCPLVLPRRFHRGVGIVLHFLFQLGLDPGSSDDLSAPMVARLMKGSIPLVLSLSVLQFPLSALLSHSDT